MIILIQSMCETVPCLWATLHEALEAALLVPVSWLKRFNWSSNTMYFWMMVSIAPVLTVHWVGHKGFKEGKPEESHFNKIYYIDDIFA